MKSILTIENRILILVGKIAYQIVFITKIVCYAFFHKQKQKFFNFDFLVANLLLCSNIKITKTNFLHANLDFLCFLPTKFLKIIEKCFFLKTRLLFFVSFAKI